REQAVRARASGAGRPIAPQQGRSPLISGLTTMTTPSQATYPKFLDSVETLPRPALRALQWRRLQRVLPSAYENSPLIRTVWQKAGVAPADIRSLEDYFTRAPLIDKEMIRAYRAEHGDPFGGVMCEPVRGTLI